MIFMAIGCLLAFGVLAYSLMVYALLSIKPDLEEKSRKEKRKEK